MTFEEKCAEREREFEEQRLRIIQAEENLRFELLVLRNISGASLKNYSVGNAGIGRTAEVIETLMACVDALSTRVTLLEQNV